jgi:alanine-glyoxylate transaminase / serine-glyoxylate transaminase / serine-pyruvate transaminase
MIEKYWGSEGVYHHTAPISMNYALHEALRVVLEEGLEAGWRRHRQVHEVFMRKMRKLEIQPAVTESIRAPMINVIRTPEGADDAKPSGLAVTRFHRATNRPASYDCEGDASVLGEGDETKTDGLLRWKALTFLS